MLKNRKLNREKNNDKSKRKIQGKITSLIRKSKELLKRKLTTKENEIRDDQCKSAYSQDKRRIKNLRIALIEG